MIVRSKKVIHRSKGIVIFFNFTDL